MWAVNLITLFGGFVLLVLGGEILVRGAARLAETLGVSATVVGLTVVAFGTSAPEAAVTISAALHGSSELAIGNVMGSNIANVLLILGCAALINPLPVSRALILVDSPIMLAVVAILAGVAAIFGHVGRLTGILFVVGLVAYTITTYWAEHHRPKELSGGDVVPLKGPGRYALYNLALTAAGIVGLVYGARLIVSGATGLARLMDISEHVIGLTIVAIGTSLPELATAVVAARHRRADIVIGNIVGSNVFNVLFVTGLTAAIRPLAIPADAAHVDGPLMVGACAVFMVVVATGRRVSRAEGLLLLGLYAAYLSWTGLRAAL
jgi:cation:H+ antiporter